MIHSSKCDLTFAVEVINYRLIDFWFLKDVNKPKRDEEWISAQCAHVACRPTSEDDQNQVNILHTALSYE